MDERKTRRVFEIDGRIVVNTALPNKVVQKMIVEIINHCGAECDGLTIRPETPDEKFPVIETIDME